MAIKIKRREKADDRSRGVFKPMSVKPVTQEDIDAGLKKMFKDANRQKDQKISLGDKPFGQKPFGPQQKQQPKLTFEPTPPEPEPKEDEPYWSAEEWERWAYDMYSKYPDTRQFLPSWFIEAVENQ